ncbi:hypothetical protein F5J12DRAFT_783834 [Pisolithus orientalis]|uniref:uncharacterized protein n=1 Tax=Pisolithus orientalis TaxID=936130 RepID=UPI0022254467|nr:uncharacterized protein F5J12DRAFT_783834 [Pisolithus orientalis]KAI6002352.1 hypothetical protein F5J12DRAFT_783834 [Pisolithus orientalis]
MDHRTDRDLVQTGGKGLQSGSMELLEYMECKQVPMTVLTSHAQPQSPSEKTKSKGPSPGNLDEMAEMPGFETKEFSLSMNEQLTMELQEAAKLNLKEDTIKAPSVSKEMQQLADESLISKIPLKFEVERLEEHMKSMRVEDEALEVLASSCEADKSIYEGNTNLHRTWHGMEQVKMKVIVERIEIEKPSRLVT